MRFPLLVATFLLAVSVNSHARASPSVALVIRTIPPLAGVPFVVDGQRLVSHDGGVVTASVAPGRHSVQAAPPRLVRRGQRISFSLWSDGVSSPQRNLVLRSSTVIEAGFFVSRTVSLGFTDVRGESIAPDAVDSFTVADDAGQKRRFAGWSPGVAGPTALYWKRHPPGTRWLDAERPIRSTHGLGEKAVSYRVVEAQVGGNDVPVHSDAFFPSRDLKWRIELPVREVSVTAQDFLFRFPIGSNVLIERSNSSEMVEPLSGGTGVSVLPPRSRVAGAGGGGVAFSFVSTSTPTEVTVAVISLLDLGVALLLVGAVIVGALARRRYRPRRAAVVVGELTGSRGRAVGGGNGAGQNPLVVRDGRSGGLVAAGATVAPDSASVAHESVASNHDLKLEATSDATGSQRLTSEDRSTARERAHHVDPGSRLADAMQQVEEFTRRLKGELRGSDATNEEEWRPTTGSTEPP